MCLERFHGTTPATYSALLSILFVSFQIRPVCRGAACASTMLTFLMTDCCNASHADRKVSEREQQRVQVMLRVCRSRCGPSSFTGEMRAGLIPNFPGILAERGL